MAAPNIYHNIQHTVGGGGAKILTTWPESSNICCWNCTHDFKTKPVFLPYYFNERKKLFHTRGVFCSFGCLKRFNTDRNHGNSHISSLISYMYKIIQGEIRSGVHTSPPVHCLKKFGGILTIAQYRESSQKRTSHRTMMSLTDTFLDPVASSKKQASTKATKPTINANEPEKLQESSKRTSEQAVVLKRAFSKITGATKTKSETLKLKRNKEITDNNGNELINNTLLHHMGIVINRE